MLGTAYHAMDDTDTALPLHKKAIALGNAASYGNLGILYFGLGKYDEAARNFAKAVELDPGSPLKNLNLADAYAQLGRGEDARAAYLRALQLSQAQLDVNPRDTKALARLAVIESKLGRMKDAADHIARAVAADPKNPDVHFYQAVVHVRAGRLEAATTALGEAFKCGFSRKRASADPDLAPLRRLASYQTLITNNEGGGAQ
jgi:tetratricopeptide (TPR) repeat protein